MRLRFSPSGSDEAAFFAARDTLLDEFGCWLDSSDADTAELLGDVDVFLDWRYGYSTGVLDEFADADVEEFLLGWCPRKLSVPAEDAEGICRAIGAYAQFMAETGRLVGGVDRAAALTRLADDLAPTMRAAMDNPANFGMAKSLFAGLDDISGMSEDELKAALQAQLDAHNALPIEQRRALTDRFFEPEPAPEPWELPFLYVPPLESEVEAAAAQAPVLAKVAALREFLGQDGKPLTGKGNLKLADGRALIELLDTGDEMDPRVGDKTFRTVSTADLPRLMFLLDVAKKAGAVRVYRRRLVPTKAWAPRATVEQATALLAATIELGPLQSLFSGRVWFFDVLHQLLDDGIALWLSPMLGPRISGPFADLLELPKTVASQQLAPYWPQEFSDDIEKYTMRDIGTVFEILELAGALQWTERSEVPDTFGPPSWTGGTVGLTALGRRVLPDYLEDVGVVLRRADGLADADGTALIEALLSLPDAQIEDVVAAWQLNHPAAERVRLLTEAITTARTARGRLIGFAALETFDVDLVEPVVRELLDTPVAGNAAMWLMAHDRADMASLGSFVDTGAMVDVFASIVDDPDQLCDMFTTGPDPDQPFRLLEDMWRHPAPETAQVLDALGAHLGDRKLAKAARKAAMRHRSWMANRA